MRMPKHPNEDRLEKLYECFATGAFDQVLAMCYDNITFTVPGETPFSGVHTKTDFKEWIGKVWAISGGTFREVPYGIVANDYRGMVLLTHSLTRDGKEVRYRTVH